MSGKEQKLIEKGYSSDIVYELCNYKEEDLDIAVDKAIKLLTENVKSVSNPVALYIGGQPGVGKSVLSDKLKNNSNSVEISMDACRSFHPYYEEIEKTIKYFYSNKNIDNDNQPGHDIAAFTQYFAGNMANKLIDRLSDMKYNLIIEWNMRNSKDVLNCMDKLTKKGYKNKALVLTIHEDKSFEASQIRANKMEECGYIGRRVDTNFHKLCLETIPTNVDIIYKVGIENKILDDMKVLLRNGKIVWNSKNSNDLPSRVIKEYYTNKELSEEFINDSNYINTTLKKEMLGLTMRKIVVDDYKKNSIKL